MSKTSLNSEFMKNLQYLDLMVMGTMPEEAITIFMRVL